MLHPLHERERLRPLFGGNAPDTVRPRQLLFGSTRPLQVLVDDPGHPHGALLSPDGALWEVCATDPELARAMLDELCPGRGELLFVAIAEELAAHLRARWRVVAETPVSLYALLDRSDLRRADVVDVAIVELAPDDAPRVAQVWPHGSADKLGYVRSCIEVGPTAAVRRDGEPVCFALTHLDGSIGILHTDPAHRRQGLARAVTTSLVGRLLARDQPIYCYVAAGNRASEQLVESLGLRRVKRGIWIGVQA